MQLLTESSLSVIKLPLWLLLQGVIGTGTSSLSGPIFSLPLCPAMSWWFYRRLEKNYTSEQLFRCVVYGADFVQGSSTPRPWSIFHPLVLMIVALMWRV